MEVVFGASFEDFEIVRGPFVLDGGGTRRWGHQYVALCVKKRTHMIVMTALQTVQSFVSRVEKWPAFHYKSFKAERKLISFQIVT